MTRIPIAPRATANVCCRRGPESQRPTRVPAAMPATLPPRNGGAMAQVMSRPDSSMAPSAVTLTTETTISDVATARCIVAPVANTMAGTTTNPPPMPNSPDRMPVTTPAPDSVLKQRQEMRRSMAHGPDRRSGPRRAVRHMRVLTRTTSAPNVASSHTAGMRLPIHAPTGAASMPPPASTVPAPRSTSCSRNRCRKPLTAAAPTASREIAMA